MQNKSQLLNRIQTMESHQVKTLVLEWLADTDGRLEDLEEILDEQAYGVIDHQGNFKLLTETEMATQSLKVLEEYRQNRDGVSHDRVSEWLESIGSENPLPCPK